MDSDLSQSLASRYSQRVLVVGSGGREHAITHSLLQSPRVEQVYVAPGNYGTLHEPRCSNLAVDASDIQGLVQIATLLKVGLVMVGPEQPLVDGLSDAMNAAGIPCFGPSQLASVIEASKAWSKDFMARHDLPTAAYRTFTDLNAAQEYIRQQPTDQRVVVKASGLAAGKGVLLPTSTEEALVAAASILNDQFFGTAGNEIVIEQFITGEEVSVLAFCDGRIAKGMPPAQDHKRVFDRDQGLNTGGMGAYAPTPLITSYQYQLCMDIVQRTVDCMAAEGRPFVGVLYAGFILTSHGPQVGHLIQDLPAPSVTIAPLCFVVVA
jgi:phosphoribosylamine--glycine ligase/phosphoribosylformylglycinamidine cyclo-ligase